MGSNEVQTFLSWFLLNKESLRNSSTEQAAEAIGAAVLKVDQRLGVEVSDQENETREMIITAFSDRTLFAVVRQIVEQIEETPGWRFVALKPARGFAFSITAGKQRIRATTLEFIPIPDIVGGVQLLLPHSQFVKLPAGEDGEELAWLIVETGIGEELASKLQHVEFFYSDKVSNRLKITELADFVNRSL